MKHLPLLLSCALTFGCSQAEKSNTQLTISNANAITANSNLNISSESNTFQSNSTKQEAISPEGKFFELLTADSNYFDVVKLLGTPDAETDLPQLKSPIPVILAFYRQNACVLFINKDSPQEKGIKSNYKYVGTIKIQPPEILHSAKPENLDFLEAVRTIVIKNLLESVQNESKQKGR